MAVKKPKESFKKRKESVKKMINPVVTAENAHEILTETMLTFTMHYLRSVEEEKKRCDPSNNEGNGKRKTKRAELRALTKMLNENSVLKHASRIGGIPGIEVGHKFFSRAEMKVLGFQHHHMNGIDCISQREKKGYEDYTLPIAVCIVVSGNYEDNLDNSDEIVYTGEGGNDLLGNKRQIDHQKLERGNLGLKNSMLQYVPVRVVRKHKCEDKTASNYIGVAYTYDGLYKVDSYSVCGGVSQFTVYKFHLTRLPGQCSLTTEQVKFSGSGVPKSPSDRGLVCNDISQGLEKYPIPAINLIDGSPVPPSDKFIEVEGDEGITRVRAIAG